MKFSGLQKCSFVDFPGKIAAVIFTQGCNFNCTYCHNRCTIENAKNVENTGHIEKKLLDESDVLAFLAKRRGMLDGVVVSGGEPTLRNGLENFIRKVRLMGFAVKLDTNGTRPNVVKSLLDARLLDFVAMDVKAPLHRYEQITRRTTNINAIRQSIDLLLGCDVDYEFRTTLAPQLSAADVLMIATRIHGAKRYAIQQYRRVENEDDTTTLNTDERIPHSDQYVLSVADLVRPMVSVCEVRGVSQAVRNAAEYEPAAKKLQEAV